MNLRQTRIVFIVVLLLVTLHTLAQDTTRAVPIPVCELLKDPGARNGERVVVSGILLATLESVRLQGKECGKSVYVIDKLKENGSDRREWDNAVDDQVGMINISATQATLEGVFEDHIAVGTAYIARLQLTRVVNLKRESKTTE